MSTLQQLGQGISNSFDEEARLIREAQQTTDPNRLQQIQGTLSQLEQLRGQANAEDAQMRAQKSQMLGLDAPPGTASAGPTGGGPRGTLAHPDTNFDPRIQEINRATQEASSSAPQKEQPENDFHVQTMYGGTAGAPSAADAAGMAGLDMSDPTNIMAAKAAVAELQKEGKPVGIPELQAKIMSKIGEAKMKKLEMTAKEMSFKKSIAKDSVEVKAAMDQIANKGQSIGLSSKVVNDVQTKTIAAMNVMANMNVLNKSFEPKFFERFNVTKLKALKQAEKLGIGLTDGQKKDIKEFTVFEKRVKQFFNQYRKDITGAQASEKEIKILEDSFLSMSFSPTEFKAAMEGLRAKAKLEIELNKMMLKDGIPGEDLDELIENDPRLKKLTEKWNVAVGLAGTVSSQGSKQLTPEQIEATRKVAKARGLI